MNPKMTFLRIPLALVVLLALQCKEANPESETAAEETAAEETAAEETVVSQEGVSMKAVIAVHDEVMPRMNDISKLVAELKPLADSAEAGDPHRKAMEDLQAAHKSMMDWMQGFGENFSYEETMKGKELSREKQAILEEEAIKVEAMRRQVEASIAQAQELLGKE